MKLPRMCDRLPTLISCPLIVIIIQTNEFEYEMEEGDGERDVKKWEINTFVSCH
jgi:hypothetical protein